MKLLKQIWPELLACCLAFASLAMSWHNHNQIQERIHSFDIDNHHPHFEHVPGLHDEKHFRR